MWENIHKMVGSDSVISMINPTTGHGLEEQEHPAGKFFFWFRSSTLRCGTLFSHQSSFRQNAKALIRSLLKMKVKDCAHRRTTSDHLVNGWWMRCCFTIFERNAYIIWNSKATFVLRYPNLAVTCRDNLMQNKQVWWMLGPLGGAVPVLTATMVCTTESPTCGDEVPMVKKHGLFFHHTCITQVKSLLNWNYILYSS